MNFTVCQYFKRYLVLNKKNQVIFLLATEPKQKVDLNLFHQDLKVDLEASEKKCLEKFDGSLSLEQFSFSLFINNPFISQFSPEELRESEEEQMEAGDYPDSPQWLK